MNDNLWRKIISSNWIVCFLLIVVCFFVYYPVLNNKLLNYWDDQWMVMNHYTESGWTFSNFWNVLTHFYNGQYGPVDEYLYMLLYSIGGGYNPTLFHAASLLLHIGCSCMAYIMLKQIINYSEISISTTKAHWISLNTVLFFAVHPFNVESVAWMSASKILVYAFFYLWATIVYMSYLKKHSIWLYFYAIMLFMFSFGGKEQAVTFPIWLLFIYWMLGKNLCCKRIWLELLPFFILSIVFGIITVMSQVSNGSSVFGGEQAYPFWQRIIFACYSFAEYVFKCFIPYKLLYIYPFPVIEGEPLPVWMLLYPALLFISCLCLLHYLKNRLILLGVLIFCIHIVITLHIVPISRFAIIADRYVYISSLGIGLLISYGCVTLYSLCPKYKYLIIVLWFFYLAYLGIYANQRARVWYDISTLKKELRELIDQRNDIKIDESLFLYQH